LQTAERAMSSANTSDRSAASKARRAANAAAHAAASQYTSDEGSANEAAHAPRQTKHKQQQQQQQQLTATKKSKRQAAKEAAAAAAAAENAALGFDSSGSSPRSAPAATAGSKRGRKPSKLKGAPGSVPPPRPVPKIPHGGRGGVALGRHAGEHSLSLHCVVVIEAYGSWICEMTSPRLPSTLTLDPLCAVQLL
jgi:hypothetical protein